MWYLVLFSRKFCTEMLWNKILFKRLEGMCCRETIRDSQHGWGVKGHLGLSAPTPAPSGTPRAGCPGPHTCDLRRSLRKRPQNISGQPGLVTLSPGLLAILCLLQRSIVHIDLFLETATEKQSSNLDSAERFSLTLLEMKSHHKIELWCFKSAGQLEGIRKKQCSPNTAVRYRFVFCCLRVIGRWHSLCS